ncbi:MAG: hypothetical protein ACLSDQ_01685 [Adlercreutzia equolifaciens]
MAPSSNLSVRLVPDTLSATLADRGPRSALWCSISSLSASMRTPSDLTCSRYSDAQ